MNGQYILNAAGEPEVAPDLMTWGHWMQTAERHVALDEFDQWRVSTVFLGLNHSFKPGAAPVLFETMVFDALGEGGDCRRYTTRGLALAGHRSVVTALRAKLTDTWDQAKQLLTKISNTAN